jgi:hypothetical protein
MLINKPLSFAENYIDSINMAIQAFCPERELTRLQKYWLAFCITSILITNSVCWARFQRVGMGRYKVAALSWMFRKSRIPWGLLLQMSIVSILDRYGITEGALGIDDTDNKRSKSTKKIAYVHKVKDKASGGYIMGQSIVFSVLITSKITIPVGFAFHVPDPALRAWRKKDKELRKKNTAKAMRPAEPPKNPNYPTIPQIALSLIKQFKQNHGQIRIRCIFADALYGTAEFVDEVGQIYKKAQVISQIRYNQNVHFRKKVMSVEEYFTKYPGVEQNISIRGAKKVPVTIASARLYVHAHGKKRFVIALKYEGETDYRYIIASDLSWRTIDIVEAYTFRWLVEVFFQDWKGYEGWGQLTKHPGEEGASRSLILSLMVDHCLFLHPDQLALIENNLPASTVGSLAAKIKVECLISTIAEIITSDEPTNHFKKFAKQLLEHAAVLSPSKKHLVGITFEDLAPTPSLKYKNAAA